MNVPFLQDGQIHPQWQRWLSALVIAVNSAGGGGLGPGLFTPTLRVYGGVDTVAAFTVGDSTGFGGPNNSFGVISNGPGSQNFLYVGPDPLQNFALGWQTAAGFLVPVGSDGAVIASYNFAAPIVIDGSVILLGSQNPSSVGVGTTSPTGILNVVGEAIPTKTTFSVGDATGFPYGINSSVFTSGPSQETFVYIGPTPLQHLAIYGNPSGGYVGIITSDTTTIPIRIDGSAVILNGFSGTLVGIGVEVPLACCHIQAGTANYPQVILDPGTLTSSPMVGALEYTDDGTDGHLYFTRNVAGVPTRGEVQIV